MQDRFRFRGVHPVLAEVQEIKFIDFIHNTVDFGDGDIFDIKDVKIQQCIGLKDKNNKLIYEDDILYCPNNKYFKFIIKKYEPYTEYVLYDYQEKHKCNWYFNQIEETRIKNNKLINLEVVGNTYENPELLKDEV